MAKPFLILQLRPEDAAADDELQAFMRFGGLEETDIHRVRMEQQSIPSINLKDYSGVIVGGGPSCVSDPEEKKSQTQLRFEEELTPLLDKIIEADFPYLGACYGLGFLAKHLGGEVSKEKYGEGVGAVTIRLTREGRQDPLLADVTDNFRAFGGHKESVQSVPPGAVLLAGSEGCPVHLIRCKKNIYGVQFHTELDTEGLIVRINTYKYAGYFPPEAAEELIEAARKETVDQPGKILHSFIDTYRR